MSEETPEKSACSSPEKNKRKTKKIFSKKGSIQGQTEVSSIVDEENNHYHS